MSQNYEPGIELEGELKINKDDFAADSVDDEVRADDLCRKLLKRFYFTLLESGTTPEEATTLAGGADYFVRDFVVGFKHRNLFDERPGLVRQFAGTWYIINTIEPAIAQLSGYLNGIRSFHRFLCERGLISRQYLDTVELECDSIGFYESRISSFWEIKGDGYIAWEQECSLKND